MPLIAYKPKRFAPSSADVIHRANEILREYAAQGFDLTLRQLYYQFVARALIRNTDRDYKRLGSIVNDARLAGLIDWNSITDRTRFVRDVGSWESPQSIINASASQYLEDAWASQPTHVEVWIEKDALVGVIEGICTELRVPYLSCRGYVSQSEMWRAAQRMGRRIRADQDVVVLHLGDHDPSGIDMSRDIRERIQDFIWGDGFGAHRFELKRLALNMDQIEQYDPPPNPAKLSDARAAGYVALHGYESWELDALEPRVIAELIEEAVLKLRDDELWQEALADEAKSKELLEAVSSRWSEIATFLNGDSA